MYADIQKLMDQLAEANRWAEMLGQKTIRPPESGEWGAPQCLDHLAKTNRIYTAAMREAVAPVLHLGRPKERRPIRPGWLTRKFIERMEPGRGNHFRAVAAVLPEPGVEWETALQEFLRSQQAAESLLRESAELDLNRIRFRNPFVKWVRFTVGGGFLILAAHNRRHLAQAARLCPDRGSDPTAPPLRRAAAGGQSG